MGLIFLSSLNFITNQGLSQPASRLFQLLGGRHDRFGSNAAFKYHLGKKDTADDLPVFSKRTDFPLIDASKRFLETSIPQYIFPSCFM